MCVYVNLILHQTICVLSKNQYIPVFVQLLVFAQCNILLLEYKQLDSLSHHWYILVEWFVKVAFNLN